MSLRTRLILSYATLILLLGLAAWWGVRRLTADLTVALGETAASVGRQVVTVLSHERKDLQAGESTDAARQIQPPIPESIESVQREVVVLRTGTPDAAAPGRRDRRSSSDATVPPKRVVRMALEGRETDPEELVGQLGIRSADGFRVRHEVHAGTPSLVLSSEGFRRTIALPRAGVDAALHRYTEQLGWGLLSLLALGLIVSMWLAQRIARPLRALAQAARTVGQGTLGAQAPDGGVPEVRQTIAAFNQMSARLQQLDAEAAALRADRELAELGEIGRGLAHSLRNPLHALGLSLEALASEAGSGSDAGGTRAQSLAQAGREQLQRVDQALRGFLALSATDGAGSAPVALREVIDDVLLEASQRSQGRVGFRREGDNAVLRAIAAELRVMLHALVVNALEASPEGGQVTVRVHGATATGEALTVEISDEGDGLPDAIRARLFQPHVSGKPHGAGMGLYLAERLARLRYRGSITLEPRMPRGTTACLRLHPRHD